VTQRAPALDPARSVVRSAAQAGDQEADQPAGIAVAIAIGADAEAAHTAQEVAGLEVEADFPGACRRVEDLGEDGKEPFEEVGCRPRAAPDRPLRDPSTWCR
jgi:hypothetical protein